MDGNILEGVFNNGRSERLVHIKYYKNTKICHITSCDYPLIGTKPFRLKFPRSCLLWTFRRPFMGRPVPRQLMRNELLDLTTIVPATAYHRRSYAKRYSRFSLRSAYQAIYVTEILARFGTPTIFWRSSHNVRRGKVTYLSV